MLMSGALMAGSGSWALLALVFFGIALVLLYYFRTGAPPVPASPEEVQQVIALLRDGNVKPGALVYELGCGWGGLALALARAFPQTQFRGIELSPLPFCVAKLRAWGYENLEVVRADFHDFDLSDADAVVCYLMIGPMLSLATTLDRQLKRDVPVVSVAFSFRDRRVFKTGASSKHGAQVRLYRWPAQAGGGETQGGFC